MCLESFIDEVLSKGISISYLLTYPSLRFAFEVDVLFECNSPWISKLFIKFVRPALLHRNDRPLFPFTYYLLYSDYFHAHFHQFLLSFLPSIRIILLYVSMSSTVVFWSDFWEGMKVNIEVREDETFFSGRLDFEPFSRTSWMRDADILHITGMDRRALGKRSLWKESTIRRGRTVGEMILVWVSSHAPWCRSLPSSISKYIIFALMATMWNPFCKTWMDGHRMGIIGWRTFSQAYDGSMSAYCTSVTKSSWKSKSYVENHMHRNCLNLLAVEGCTSIIVSWWRVHSLF